MDLQVMRQAGGELDNPMIEERWPNFQRVRHAHPVCLVEDVVGQVVILIDVQEVACQQRRPLSIEAGLQQCLPLPGAERSIPEEVRLSGGSKGSLQHPLHFVVEADFVVGHRQQPATPTPPSSAAGAGQPQFRGVPIRKIGVVAAEQLVGAFAAERDSDCAAGSSSTGTTPAARLRRTLGSSE